jgi:hypothetical protein
MAPPAFAVMVSSGSCDTLGALLEESASLSASTQLTLPPTVVLRELGSHGKSLVAASMLPAAAAVIEAEAPLLKVSALLLKVRPISDRPAHIRHVALYDAEF